MIIADALYCLYDTMMTIFVTEYYITVVAGTKLNVFDIFEKEIFGLSASQVKFLPP